MFPFVEFIKQYIPISKDIENEIIDQLKFETFTKGDTLLKSQRVCNWLYFLEKQK